MLTNLDQIWECLKCGALRQWGNGMPLDAVGNVNTTRHVYIRCQEECGGRKCVTEHEFYTVAPRGAAA